MKIIYALFRSSILERLHTCLSEEVDLNPVYVIGDCDNINNVDFKKTIFHSIKDSRNGIPTKEYKFKYKSNSDDDFHKYISIYENIAISMMGRQSENQWSFSYVERVNHFHYLCNFWYEVVKDKNPDVALFRVIPHFASEYVLFYVCKYLKIKVICEIGTGPFGYGYLVGDIEDQGLISSKDNAIQKIDFVEKFIKENLNSYSVALPKYMLDNFKHQSISSSYKYLMFSIVKDVIRVIWYKNKKISETIKRIFHPVYDKKSQQDILSFSLHKLRARQEAKKNKKIYYSICKNLHELPKKYVFFAPNYQPERSNMPDAGEFHDMLKILDILSATVPKDCVVVYKEHPMVFNYPGKIFFRGHLFRNIEYYDRAQQYSNVVFLKPEEDTFNLISNAISVVTATGTIAVQSSIRGTPSVVFGNNWITGCDAIYKYTSRLELKHYFNELNNSLYNNANNVEIWRMYLKDIYLNGFPEPGLLNVDKDFEIKNSGYIEAILKELYKLDEMSK